MDGRDRLKAAEKVFTSDSTLFTVAFRSKRSQTRAESNGLYLSVCACVYVCVCVCVHVCVCVCVYVRVLTQQLRPTQ